MIVKQNPDGTWGIYRGPNGKQDIAGPFKTNSDAWRWLDRQTGEPISRSEKTSEYLFAKMASGE